MVDSSIARRDKKGPVQSFHLRAALLEELSFSLSLGEERGADPTDVWREFLIFIKYNNWER